MQHIQANLPGDDPIGRKGKEKEAAFCFLSHACRLSTKLNVFFSLSLALKHTFFASILLSLDC